METRFFRDVRYRDMNFEMYIVPRVHHVHHRGRIKVFFITLHHWYGIVETQS